MATPGFVLLVRDRGDGCAAKRLGITVTKKIGNAVVRNRMKRRFRALAREIIANGGRAGADHVLIGRAGGVERDYATLRAELVQALARAEKILPVYGEVDRRSRDGGGAGTDVKVQVSPPLHHQPAADGPPPRERGGLAK